MIQSLENDRFYQLPEHIGRRIRRRRKELDLNLRELGKRTGLTAGFLSKVENSKGSLSLNSLVIVAKALEVPVFYFLNEDAHPSPVVRGSERRKIQFPDSHLAYDLLTPDTVRQTMGILIHLEPGGRQKAVSFSRPTEEWMFVLAGRLEITVDETTHLLEPGDCVYYEGRALRGFASVGDEELVIVCSITPPV